MPENTICVNKEYSENNANSEEKKNYSGDDVDQNITNDFEITMVPVSIFILFRNI